MTIRTFRTRAYLTKAGHIRLDEVLRQQCLLYNAALEERREAYRRVGETVTYYAQNRSLTAVRADFPDIEGALDRRIQVGTLKRLDKAMTAFFRRVRAGETAGYPRFKSSRRWKTLELYSGASRYMRHDHRTGKGLLKIKGLPAIRFKDERVPDDYQPLEIRISRRSNGVYIYMVFDHLEARAPVGEPVAPVGINAGASGVRWGLSDGRTIPRRRTDDSRRKRLQRRIARQKKGSASRRKTVAQLSRLSERERIRNRNELHRTSAWLVREFDFFAIEDLSIRDLTRSGRGTIDKPGEEVQTKANINRSMLSQTWGEFAEMLAYKAEGAGMQLVRVDPAYTSQICSRCGVQPEHVSDAELKRVRFKCAACHTNVLRTVNAARNILARGAAVPSSSAGEPFVAGRASMDDSTAELSAVRPENRATAGSHTMPPRLSRY